MEREPANNQDKNNRKFAIYIKSKTKSRNTIDPLKREDVEMAKELNHFFSSMFTKEAPHKYQFRERGDKVEEN